MTIRTLQLEELKAVATSMQIRTQVNGPAELSITMLPADFEGVLGADWQIGDGVEVRDALGNLHYTGVIAEGAAFNNSGDRGPQVELRATGGLWWLLDKTLYIDGGLNSPRMKSVYDKANKRSITLGSLISKINSCLRKSPAYRGEEVACGETGGSALAIPYEQNGCMTCGDILRSALRYCPQVKLSGVPESTALEVKEPADLDAIVAGLPVLEDTRQVVDNGIPCLVVMGCGKNNYTIPAGVSPYTPGAVGYCCAYDQTQSEDPETDADGASANEYTGSGGGGRNGVGKKAQILGYPIDLGSISVNPALNDFGVPTVNTRETLETLYPWLGGLSYEISKIWVQIAQPMVSPGFPQPHNYCATLKELTGGFGSPAIHYSGSFPASSKEKRNYRKVKFADATLVLKLRVKASSIARERAEEVVTICKETWKQDGVLYRCAVLQITCRLLSHKRTLVNPETGQLLRSDPDYGESGEGDGGEARYPQARIKKILRDYYGEASKPMKVGSVRVWGGADYPRPRGNATADLLLNETTYSYEGTRNDLSIDERIALDELRRNYDKTQKTREVYRECADVEQPEEEDEDEDEDKMLTPDINAIVAPKEAGRVRAQFTLYLNEDNEPTMKGGRLCLDGVTFDVPDQPGPCTVDLTNGQIYSGGSAWDMTKKIKVIFNKTRKTAIIKQ